MKALTNLRSIKVHYVKESLLPARVTAIRNNDSVVTAGGKFLRTAIIALMALLINERAPNVILNHLTRMKDRVDDSIFEVL